MNDKNKLIRAVGVKGAIMMGMGSIVGTGVFVSLGLAAGITGAAMVFALLVAGALAVCNGLSSAQLAAAHPVSGGTYEYGYRFVHPWLGYLAGWLFMCAKSASAATAAIGFGGYFARIFNLQIIAPWQIGLIAAFFIICITAFGIKRSSMANILIVSITLITLILFSFLVAPEINPKNFSPFFENLTSNKNSTSAFLEATALMFVAYTGYGRIATLGEEIHNPVKNIPRAILATLSLSFILYMTVAIVAVGAVGAESFYLATIKEAAPLEVIASLVGHPWVAIILGIGAMTAMLGVLLNLVLGLSRVVYAMGKKNDLPQLFSKVEKHHGTPLVGILTSGLIIIAIIFMKDVKSTWSFSAFTVLFYYAITNLSALKLPKQKRLYPQVFAWLGLMGCLSLSFWVDKQALILGGIILFIGIVWRVFYQKLYINR